MAEREFRGIWIPAEVWLDEDLPLADKMVFGGIIEFCDGGFCSASNAELAKFCQLSERTISRAVSDLADKGYIEVAHFDGRTRLLQCSLTALRGEKR